MTRVGLESDVRSAWDFDDLAGSADRFEQHAADASDADERAVWQSQVARTYGLAGRFDEAHALLDAIASTELGPHARTWLAIERGRLLNSAGSPAEAGKEFGAAYFLASREGLYGLAVDALHMTAIVVGQINGPEAAAATTRAALALAEASADPDALRWVPSLLNNLGWIQHEQGDFEGALELFERAFAARRNQDSSPGEVLVAEWAVARTLRSLGRFEDALAIQLRLAGQPAGVDDGYVAEEIAACFESLGRPDEAQPWADRARTLLRP